MTTPVRTTPKVGTNQQVSSLSGVQKVVPNVVSAVANNSKTMPNNQGLQQLIVQPGQKLLVGQNAQGQKVLIQPSQQATTTMSAQQVTNSTPATIPQQTNQTSTAHQQHQQQQQVVVNQISGGGNQAGAGGQQKVIQQIVNTSNVQQHIMVGGQRIILSPGQTIVTQRSVPAQNASVQLIQSPATSVGTLQKTATAPLPTSLPTSNLQVQQNIQQTQKVVKQFIVQQQQQQQQQGPNVSGAIDSQNNLNVFKTQQTLTNNTNATSSSSHLASNQQQIIVQNSTLAQQLAQGKLQVATINGQQVIIKPLGNNQAQIVAHIKTQSDGNAHIVTNTPIENQTSPTKAVAQQAPHVQIPQVSILAILYTF